MESVINHFSPLAGEVGGRRETYLPLTSPSPSVAIAPGTMEG
ncbi:MAG: hypothetical protein RLZ94_937 [Actinomycetota bacterium]